MTSITLLMQDKLLVIMSVHIAEYRGIIVVIKTVEQEIFTYIDNIIY